MFASHVFVLLIYINFILVTRHPDYGHRSDRNMLVKKNNMWLDIFINVHLLVCHKVNNSYVCFETFNSVHSCSYFLLCISSKRTTYVKYIYIYIYHLLPPTSERPLPLFAQELYMAPGILIKKRNKVNFTFYSTVCFTTLQKVYNSWTKNAVVSLKMV